MTPENLRITLHYLAAAAASFAVVHLYLAWRHR